MLPVPLNLIKAIAPTPGGEDMAQIISLVEFNVSIFNCAKITNVFMENIAPK